MGVKLKRFALLAIGLCFALAIFTLPAAQVAHAAAFTVNTTNDTIDINPGDGLCVDANGHCSLRAAISEANALAGADTINMPAGVYTLTIAGTGENGNASGDLDIQTGNLDLVGASAGSTILQAGTVGGVGGNGIDRVFHVIGPVIANFSDVTIRNGRTAAPNAVPGAGIYVGSGGTVTLNRCVVADNYSELGQGAGLSLAFGSLTINDCTITGNSTTGFGGALYNANISTGGTIAINNSTVSGNSAGQGGGVYTVGAVTVRNSTIANNSAGGSNGGGIRNFGGSVTLVNALMANNTGGNCSGGVTSGGHNLDSGNTCALAGTGDLVNINPQLAALASNGGPSPTHALLFTSPAIDAGDPAVCAAVPVSGLDQRGEARNDLRCDIGAFELKLGDSSQVQKVISGAGTYTFGPTLVQVDVINDGGCLTGLDVVQTSTSYPGAPLGLQTGRYWTITPTGCSSGFDVNLTLPHTLAAFGNARVCRNLGGGQWDCVADSATVTTVTRNNISSLSVWAVGDDSLPLAVQLAGFAATSAPGHVLVTWETASELDNLGFNLYRGQTPYAPEARLAFVPAQSPGSALGAVYQWADGNVTAGAIYYYWLEDVDLSGATTLHGPVSVTYEGPTAVVLTGFAAVESQSALPAFASLATGLALAVAWARHRLRQG